MLSNLLRRMSLCFAGGCLAALIQAVLMWYLGSRGIPRQLGVSMAPKLTLCFLYGRVVWGGLWGFLFLLPMWRSGFWVAVFSRGLLYSLVPSAIQLFYIYPYVAGKGMFGLALGDLTPLFVCLYNALWGLLTALWLHAAKS